jgi:hypothetical protein
VAVTATFSRYGTKTPYKGPQLKTALFVDVRGAHDEPLCDHIWMNVGEQLGKLGLVEGDRVTFLARVTEYWKGYKGRREDDEGAKPLERDFRLSWPTKFRKEAWRGLLNAELPQSAPSTPLAERECSGCGKQLQACACDPSQPSIGGLFV